MRYSLLLLFLFSAGSASAQNSDGSGLKYSLAGDLVGTLGAKHRDTAPATRDRLLGREAELLFYGPVDQTFDAQTSMAAHFENGETNFELHELYLGSSKLIPRSRFKLGKFFLGIGRLNHVHRHDWPFVSAPEVHEEFFDEEGAEDTGLEYGYLLPLPFYLDLTVGITSGFTFGHSHTAGQRPLRPTHYFRLGTYSDLGETGGMEFGLNYLGRTAGDRSQTHLAGLDLTAKWREGKVLRYLIQTELWWRQLRSSAGTIEKKVGAYFFPQYGFNHRWFLGVRLDAFNYLNKTNVLSRQREKNISYAVVPTLSYHSSEFATFRLAYTAKASRELSRTIDSDRIIELQAIFLMGAHPAHDF